MKNKIKYELSFNEMVEKIFKQGWFQGEDFSDGVFIKVSDTGAITIYKFDEDKFGEQYVGVMGLTKSLMNQKFRECFTQSDVMRK